MKLEQYDGSEIQGFIHAYDRASTLVCVEVIPSSETVLVCADNIKSATLVSLSKDTVRMWPNVSSMSVDGGRTKTEIDRVWQKKHTQWLQTNHTITMTQTGRMTVAHIKTYAQMVFDTLAKTLPCQWDNDTIIILGSVRLDPPYDTSCISGNGDNGVVNRVRMILEKESNVLNKSVDTNGVNATSTK